MPRSSVQFTLLASLLLAVPASVGCASAAEDPPVGTTSAPLNSGYTFMSFVGHHDDDTLFMNPDLQNFLGAGYGTVTVVLTAAQANGSLDGVQSRATFSGHRQEGMRAAYAHMAGRPNSWTKGAYSVGGKTIEIDALNGAAHVQLIFLNIPEDGDDSVKEDCGGPLGCMYSNSTAFSRWTTLRPNQFPSTTTPLASVPATSYSRSELLRVLGALLSSYRPSVVRTLDPQPYERINPDQTYAVGHDNLDHYNTARFVDEALQAYSAQPDIVRFQTQYYKTYQVAQHPGNLGLSAYDRKVATFHRYLRNGSQIYDRNAVQVVAQQQADRNYSGYLGWYGATYERYPGSSTWMLPSSNGRLTAFAVQNRRVVAWSENAPGGTWTGPTRLEGRAVGPHVAAVALPSGDRVVFALELPVEQGVEPPPASPRQAVLYNRLSAAAGTWSGWVSLGSPDDGINAGRWLGAPAAAVDSRGNIAVFVRNSAGRISRRVQVGGVFQAWAPMVDPVATPYDVLDGLAAIQANDGRVHLFASTLQGWIGHWTQSAVGQTTFGTDANGLPSGNPIGNAAGPPTVAKNADGRLAVFWHGFGTADVWTASQQVSGTWSTALVRLGGHAGTGPVAAMRRGATGPIMLFDRNGYNGISATWQTAANGAFSTSWSDLGSQFPLHPSAASDANDRTVVAGVGVDGRLYIRRETGGIGTFGAWTAVGN